MLQIIFFILICSFVGVRSANLETVSDEELINLIKTEKYVVVLFTSKQRECTTCDNYENEIINLIQDLNSLSIGVVEAIDSQLLRVYSDDKEPALVFFRHGVPLLYDGPLNAEEILTMFSENKEPTVKELTDDTFEHLTQASSGATTGDWFVMFGSTDCVECSRLIPRWEAVGAKLKRRVNVARIDKYTTGASTARRFNVYETPEFIFFRHGKMYRYQIPKYDINSFTSFAKEYYKNARAETVPVPQRRLDDLGETIANFLRENPWISSIAIGVFIIISVAFKCRRTTEMAQKRD
ncbi:thioredoxin domain-containing protein [Bombus terrestris]|uniref:Thioredoxin domain-containing protein n=1 Tax=Bombus terrestris TaxID=30195 RepID=A0A9B2MM24_BOMTE|nr:thioredoxin domain-containing protein [Bombus terrestris]